jgi:hypothetical protein
LENSALAEQFFGEQQSCIYHLREVAQDVIVTLNPQTREDERHFFSVLGAAVCNRVQQQPLIKASADGYLNAEYFNFRTRSAETQGEAHVSFIKRLSTDVSFFFFAFCDAKESKFIWKCVGLISR